jgi:hypothetical protein
MNINILAYEFESFEPIYSFLATLPFLDEKELQKISLEREPRNALIKDID